MYRPKSHVYQGTFPVRAALIQSPTALQANQGDLESCIYEVASRTVLPMVCFRFWSSCPRFVCLTLCF